MSALVLASGSAARARLLAAAGVPFEISPARIDEQKARDSLAAAGKDPSAIAAGLAEMKAVQVSRSCGAGAVVVGADQILASEGALVGKARELSEARTLLRRLRGRKHELLTAAALVGDGSVVWRHVNRAELWMREFGEGFLEDYLVREGPAVLDWVGCYRLEGLGAQLFARVEGDYFSVLGLPLMPLLAALREHGVIGK